MIVSFKPQPQSSLKVFFKSNSLIFYSYSWYLTFLGLSSLRRLWLFGRPVQWQLKFLAWGCLLWDPKASELTSKPPYWVWAKQPLSVPCGNLYFLFYFFSSLWKSLLLVVLLLQFPVEIATDRFCSGPLICGTSRQTKNRKVGMAFMTTGLLFFSKSLCTVQLEQKLIKEVFTYIVSTSP